MPEGANISNANRESEATEMSGETELKPCPICQKHDTAICADGFTLAHLDENQFAVCCDVNRGGCGCMSGFRGTREDAILAWNLRVTPPGYEMVPEGAKAEEMAKLFHTAYEALAPSHGYETRVDSRTAWENVPENQRALMIESCNAVLIWMRQRAQKETPNAQGL